MDPMYHYENTMNTVSWLPDNMKTRPWVPDCKEWAELQDYIVINLRQHSREFFQQ
jgi:hypothetical protein